MDTIVGVKPGDAPVHYMKPSKTPAHPIVWERDHDHSDMPQGAHCISGDRPV